MDLWPWYLLYFITVVMPTCPGEAKKTLTDGTKNNGCNEDSPWKFLSSTNIYLHKTNISLPMSCIKANTTERNQSEETLSHVVSFKNASSGLWGHLNATYTPFNKTDKVATAFISVDPKYNVTTIYTFLNSDYKYCAVVNKWKEPTIKGFENICELWVNDEYFGSNNSEVQSLCNKNFEDQCRNGTSFSYDIRECMC
uniref:Putative lipocalin n=1 Tax=Amblyomma cajennense TaxID=34607 RepID=A0A023FQN9_AMBCJ